MSEDVVGGEDMSLCSVQALSRMVLTSIIPVRVASHQPSPWRLALPKCARVKRSLLVLCVDSMLAVVFAG
jgi:hypothetical protein